MTKMPLCKCGCGGLVASLENKYIHNHHTKNKPGRIVPEEEKRKHSQYQKDRWNNEEWRKHTISEMIETHNRPDIKLKKSKISKEQWSDLDFYNQQILAKNQPEAKKKNSESQIGNKRSEETKEKQRLSMEKVYSNPEYKLKIKQIRINLGLQLPDDQISLFNLYYRKVYYFTNISLKKKFTKQELLNRKLAGVENALHIDHKFSIKKGFQENIIPCIIGNQCNLELISWIDNYRKNTKCSITKEELFNLYDKEKESI